MPIVTVITIVNTVPRSNDSGRGSGTQVFLLQPIIATSPEVPNTHQNNELQQECRRKSQLSLVSLPLLFVGMPLVISPPFIGPAPARQKFTKPISEAKTNNEANN
jgi:hypothetical protein